MDGPRSVSLHIGAHKTATTHLQRALSQHSDVLRRRSVRLYGPSELRSEGTTLQDRFGLPGAEAAVDDPASVARQMAEGARRLILSDENFPGHFAGSKGRLLLPIYPRAVERIAALAGALAPVPLRVFLGIRDPASFLTSAYCQLLYRGARLTPFDFFADQPFDRVDWAGLVRRIHDVAQVEKIVVWRYEDYPGNGLRLCRKLLGWRGAWGMGLPQAREHLGLSEVALSEVLEGIGAGHSEAESAKCAVKARQSHPISEAHPRFDPFTAEEHAQSEALYARQVALISALPRVEML